MPTTGTMKYLTIGDSTYEVYNTDTEVIQTYAAASGYTNWRPLVVGYSSNSSETTAPTTITGTTYTFNTIKVKPSDGTIRFGAAALYNGDYTTTISADTLTAARTLTAPDKSGTIALTSDIPSLTGYATTTYVDNAITALPEPMIFKGSLGTGGTITSLPAASSSNEGFTYKVITAGTYASQEAKIGDTFISDGSSWVLIPSGDEPSGTVTSITAGVGLTTADGNPITSSGTIKTKLNSETSLGTIGSTSKLYAVGVDSNGQLGVKVPWANDQVYTIKSSSSYVDMFLTGSTSSDTSTGYLYKDPSARLKVSDSSGETGLFLGDDITEGEKLGAIYLYSQSGIYTRLTALATTMVKYISLPDKTGIIALTDDIPSISLNGSSTTSASFYAPTTAGTSGYYLKSNGSGAPTWTAAPTIPSNNVTGSGSINYLPRWSGTNTLSSTSLYISTSYNSSSDLYGTIQLCLGSTGQIDWRGQLVFHDGSMSKTITITPPSLTASRALTLPDKTGTIALTSDITDEKLAVVEVTSGTTYYPIVGTGASAATRQYDTTGFKYSANSIRSFITLGNNISEGTTGSKRGAIQIYGTADRYTQLETLITSTGAGQNTGVVVYFPDKGGTVALTSDIPTVPTISLNGSSTTSASFYAPTTAGTLGQVLTSSGSGAPTWSAITVPTKTSDLTNDSGFITGMTILSYGSSTWQNFIDAYDANKVVYCRASSNSNPASGSQTRLAFMAYVNNATTPMEVEFQYYRSVSTHTASQQGDQVYVYKLNKTAGWTVTVREASVKVVAGTGLGGTYSNGTMTLTGPTISLNGSSTTSASFYAPTTAGTSGQVLTSNGSSAPTWEDAQSGSSAQIINWTTDIITPTITETSTVPLNGYNLDDEIEFNVELENTSELYLENVELECLDTGDEWNIGTTFEPNDSSNWDSQIRVISNHIRQGYVPIRITGLGVDTNTSNTYNFSNRIKITSLATPVLSVASTYTTNGSVSAVGDQCTITYYIANQNGSNLDIEEIKYFIVKVDTISDTNTATYLDSGTFSSTIGPGESEETLDSYTYTVTADDLEMDSVAIWCVSFVTTYSEKYDPTTITSADIEDFIAYPGEDPDNPAYKWATDTTNSFIKTSYAIATVIDNTSE